jgi:DNA-binding transcriptional regulator YhcF (GntR family)
MAWKFNEDRSIHLQICDRIKHQLVTGEIELGGKIKSVRELALEAGVNPNTMQKALQELEKDGFLVTDRSTGRHATDNREVAAMLKKELAETAADSYLETMVSLQFSKEESAEILLSRPIPDNTNKND